MPSGPRSLPHDPALRPVRILIGHEPSEWRGEYRRYFFGIESRNERLASVGACVPSIAVAAMVLTIVRVSGVYERNAWPHP